MSFINLADKDLSSDDEEDVDFVPNDDDASGDEDDDQGNNVECEDLTKEEEKKLQANKEEAKRIWEEMQSESKANKLCTKDVISVPKSPCQSFKADSNKRHPEPSKGSLKSTPSSASTKVKASPLSLNIVSGEPNLGFQNKKKFSKQQSLDLNDIMNGSSKPKRKSDAMVNILSTINKKPKLTTLEKSKLDWKQFKQDEDIEEELSSFSKSKQGYVERLNFLDRTDQRQFEIEKQIRLKGNSKR